MRVDRRLILALVIAVVLTVSMFNLLLEQPSFLRVSAVETSVPLGLYWDANCSKPVDSINWGKVAIGGSQTITMFVKNEGGETVILSVSALNWKASNTSDCASFSCEEPTIAPAQVVKVDPTLTVFPNASGVAGFSFDVNFAETFITLADFGTLFASNTNVRMIYPSTNSTSTKPLGCLPAAVSDWTASAFVYVHLKNVTEGLDTQASFINQTTGEAVGPCGAGIISFGGPIVNPVIKYAESSSTVASDRAPIKFNNVNGVCHFQYANGTNVPRASMPASEVNGKEDFFVIETFSDGAGRYIMLCYGFGWQGTYAAGKYFDTVIYPNLSSQSESWIIMKWYDTNGNGLVNGPNDGDTYTVIAQGS